jgi:T-complex protein 1 subunit gamma
VKHPAAKSMIELSRSQDENVGDGTTSVVILGKHISFNTVCFCHLLLANETTTKKIAAGEMLIVSAPYLEKKIHPTVIIRGLQRALEDIVAHYQRSTRTAVCCVFSFKSPCLVH